MKLQKLLLELEDRNLEEIFEHTLDTAPSVDENDADWLQDSRRAELQSEKKEKEFAAEKDQMTA